MVSWKVKRVYKGSALPRSMRGIARVWICFVPDVAAVLQAGLLNLDKVIFVEIARRIWREQGVRNVQ